MGRGKYNDWFQMTRRSLNRTLRFVYILLIGVLALSLVSKVGPHVPLLATSPFVPIFEGVYDYLKDMSLVLVTVVAAYLANIFQKRAAFVDALKQEWRGVVDTKLALVTYCEKTYPTTDDYLEAYCRIAGAIDNMRIVYKNVGETDDLIGLYPFSPLHDMRRAIEKLDPRDNSKINGEDRAMVRAAIEQTFYALRERFLDELDLEEPTNPLTAAVSRRLKRSGATRRAIRQQERQRKRIEKSNGNDPVVDQFLSDLYYDEDARSHAESERRAADPKSGPSASRRNGSART